jgi:hypothetical protein
MVDLVRGVFICRLWETSEIEASSSGCELSLEK